jgi:hypothetical protein
MSREKAEGDNLDLMPTYALEAGPSFSDGDPSRQNSFAHSLPSSSPEIPGHTSESLSLAKLWFPLVWPTITHAITLVLVEIHFSPARLLFVDDATPSLCSSLALPGLNSARYSA